MAKARRIITNLSKGEWSPLLDGRPDLQGYYESGKTVENWYLLRQGGLRRRPGLRFIAEVKTSAKDTIILPFEASVNDAFVVEVGDAYMRFYKNKAQLKTSAGGPAVEVVSPYTEAQIRSIHFTQSVDVMFLFHPTVQQRRLSRVSDTSWVLSAITYTPPPSFEADTDISGGTATLTPGATTGTGVTFTASSAVFLADGDQGRQIIFGASRAVITQVGPSAGSTGAQSVVTADILDDFPDTDPIAAGSWFLRLSPQTTLDPNIKEPVGAQVTLVAGTDTFRAADVGKFIHIYGGVVKITVRDSNIQVKGTILSVMGGTTDANPAPAPAGAWTLEVESWSAANGFPRTGEFYQGRLGQASTTKQPTTFWLSESDNFDSYAVGTFADNAVEHTIASRALNRIEWLADNIDLFAGTSGSEMQINSGREAEPIGGDIIPLVQRLTRHGSAAIQPIVISRRAVFVDRSLQKVLSLGFSWEEDGFDAVDLTAPAEHITGAGVKLGPLAFATRPDPRLYLVRGDGTLLTLTLHYQERVIGFTRLVTDGLFESVAVIPTAAGGPDQVWVIVNRTINGQTKRYVEMFEEAHASLSSRQWDSLQTDSAIVYSGSATTTITGLSHLEAKTVDVVADGSFVGTKVVSGGQITLDVAASQVEVGLSYVSTLETMRPGVEGTVVEGLARSWTSVFVRLKDSIGGKLNGEVIEYEPSPLNELDPFTGDRKITGSGWDQNDGRITVVQDQPYPFLILALFGTIDFSEHD